MNTRNVLSILGIAQNEDAVTNLLANLIEDVAAFRVAFLREFLGIDEFELDRPKVRKKIGKSGIPDLILCASDGSRAVVLENKLKADEGFKQTEKYASKVGRDELREILGLTTEAIEFFYLSLLDHQAPRDPAFKVLKYERLIPLLVSASTSAGKPHSRLMADFASILESFYDRRNLDWEARFNDALTEDHESDPLDGSFFAFRCLFEEISHDYDLEFKEAWIGNDRGRPTYGCQLSKIEWCRQEAPSPTEFEPREHFYVHFEPKFHRITRTLDVPIHFETMPYMTKATFENSVSAARVQAWRELAGDFRSALISSRISEISGFSPRRGRLQTCKFDIQTEGRTVRQVRDQISSIIKEATPMIDATLDKLALPQAN